MHARHVVSSWILLLLQRSDEGTWRRGESRMVHRRPPYRAYDIIRNLAAQGTTVTDTAPSSWRTRRIEIRREGARSDGVIAGAANGVTDRSMEV